MPPNSGSYNRIALANLFLLGGLAEGAVHEAFFRIARHQNRFERMSGDECRYLCLAIVKNAALNILRSQDISIPVPEELPVGPLASVEGSEDPETTTVPDAALSVQ